MSPPAPARPKSQQTQSESRNLWPWIIGGVLFLAVAAAIVVSVSGDETDSTATGTVEVVGSELPLLDPNVADPAVGQPIPEVFGTGFDDQPVDILADGRPKAIVFLAHWCPVCQSEVDELVSYLQTESFNPAVDVIGVSTLVDASRGNYPPGDWLEGAGWEFPTLRDDNDNSVATAYGMRGTPFWVFVDSNGDVALRNSGALGPADVDAIIEQLAAGPA